MWPVFSQSTFPNNIQKMMISIITSQYTTFLNNFTDCYKNSCNKSSKLKKDFVITILKCYTFHMLNMLNMYVISTVSLCQTSDFKTHTWHWQTSIVTEVLAWNMLNRLMISLLVLLFCSLFSLSVYCVQCCICFWIVQWWLPLRFALTVIYFQRWTYKDFCL
jgi:hypothetical protein